MCDEKEESGVKFGSFAEDLMDLARRTSKFGAMVSCHLLFVVSGGSSLLGGKERFDSILCRRGGPFWRPRG